MSTQGRVITVITLCSLAAGGWLFAQSDEAERIRRVLVVNLGNPQQVEGEVRVRGTIKHSDWNEFADLTVSPAARSETNQLTDAGVLETDGFTSLTLSFQGQVKDNVFRPGEIGVVLLPAEEPFNRALLEFGEIHLPLEVSTQVAPGHGAYFSGSQASLPIAFPRYRVLLYNSTERSAEVNVYAYLAN